MTPGESLLELVATELAQPVASAGARALTERIRALHGTNVRAVLFYGSCLRRGDDEGVFDLYALVDDYRAANRSWLLAVLNRFLPPNVFYLEVPVGEHRVRCKYAILSRRDLLRRTSPRGFEPYFWARFAQPCVLVYASDEAVRREVAAALATAVVTTVLRGVPLVAPRFGSRDLWTATWRQSYRSEVRAERRGAVETLWESAAERFERVTRLALPELPYPTQVDAASDPVVFTVSLPAYAIRRAKWGWRVRQVYAKTLFLLRIVRNAFIFEGAVDYALWKIQRHTGIEVDYGWRNRRHPWRALAAEAWRLFRLGAFR